jgi:UDP-N-acetyl-D-mannosaminuronic acid dehydrogenase
MGGVTGSSARLLERCRERIASGSAVLGFIGLGYVGLPVGLAFAAAGFEVRGFDIDEQRVAALREGHSPFAPSEPGLIELLTSVLPGGHFRFAASRDVLADAEVFFLAIDTPVNADHHLNRARFEAGLDIIGGALREGALVIIESTIPPGTIDGSVIPYLDRRSGLRAGETYFILHCPERLRPGRLLHNLRNLARLVGGDTEVTSAIGVLLYRNVVFAPLQPVHYRMAEVVKTAENAARDVQIALANQLAVVCDQAGVDVGQVRAAINDLWSREPLILEPGPGVGGHCLPKDPWLMVDLIDEPDARALVTGARAMNNYMPTHVAAIVRRALGPEQLDLADAVVLLLGVAYNADSDDTRNSPAIAVAELLQTQVKELRQHDPLVAGYAKPLSELATGADVVVLLVAHAEYRKLDLAALRTRMRHRVIVDTRRALDAQTCSAAGFRYVALGVSALRSPAG